MLSSRAIIQALTLDPKDKRYALGVAKLIFNDCLLDSIILRVVESLEKCFIERERVMTYHAGPVWNTSYKDNVEDVLSVD